jgi:metal-responsive CopG/Arc/MetJ family transcriptional regulator
MAKIAISLPDDILKDIEDERLAAGETRSEFFRRAVKAYFQNKRKREDIERYVRGYLEQPETEEELAWVEAASQAVLAEYPWEDEAE